MKLLSFKQAVLVVQGSDIIVIQDNNPKRTK
jgi:hypothetical protein